MIDIDIKDCRKEHLPFVYATWLNAMKMDQSTRYIRKTVFFPHYKQIAEKVMARERTKIKLAHPKGEPDVILGYFVYENAQDIAHFLYVKKDFRQFGIATALIKESGIDPNNCICTHRTSDCNWLINKFVMDTQNPSNKKPMLIPGKYPNVLYNPFLLK